MILTPPSYNTAICGNDTIWTDMEELKQFDDVPLESVEQLSNRFEDSIFPLLDTSLVNTRGLALLLRPHLPSCIRKSTLKAMRTEDERWMTSGNPLVTVDELLQFATQGEYYLLELEREMISHGLTPNLRPEEKIENNKSLHCEERTEEDRLSPLKRLGPIGSTSGDQRQEVVEKRIKTAKDHRTLVGPHHTAGYLCERCDRVGHTLDHCWVEHPDQIPEAIRVETKKSQAKYARRQAIYQCMAVTCVKTILTTLLRRSTRQRRPPTMYGSEMKSTTTKVATSFPPTWWALNKKFYPELPPPVYDSVNNFWTATMTTTTSEEVEEIAMENPLNNTQTTTTTNEEGESSGSTIGYIAKVLETLPLPSPCFQPQRENKPYFRTTTPAFLYTEAGTLDLNGYIPTEAIIDTGASKAMISRYFAGISLTTLGEGGGFVAASGEISQPLGVTTVVFTLMRGTEHELKVELEVTVVLLLRA